MRRGRISGEASRCRQDNPVAYRPTVPGLLRPASVRSLHDGRRHAARDGEMQNHPVRPQISRHLARLAWLAAALTTSLPGASAQAADEAALAYPNFVNRPVAITFDGGMGAPTGFFGMSVGYTLPKSLWAVELGGGLGSTGTQIAVQGKYYLPIFGSLRHALVLQGGPSLGLIGKPVGMAVPRKDSVVVTDSDVFYTLWLHAGAAWEVRWGWGGLIRVAAGGMLNTATSQAALCDGVDTVTEGAPGAGTCTSRHFALGPEVSRARVLPWLQFSYGWSF